MKIEPLSATVGAVITALLLFACSSKGANNNAPLIPQTPSVSTQVTFYSDTPASTGAGDWSYVFSLGTTSATTVLTDVSWAGQVHKARLMVNGAPAYVWGFGGENTGGSSAGAYGYSVAPRFSLSQGIKVPANAVLTIESGGYPEAWSMAGYKL